LNLYLYLKARDGNIGKRGRDRNRKERKRKGGKRRGGRGREGERERLVEKREKKESCSPVFWHNALNQVCHIHM